MSKVKWSKVSRGDTVVAGGIPWVVEKIKIKGKRAKVTIRNGSRVAESKVDLADKVKLAPSSSAPKKEKPRKPISRKPPAPATGNPWETQEDRIEKKLDQILGAKLIGEGDERGFYVPPPDITTIDTHMLVFHGGIPDVRRDSIIEAHAKQHLLAEAGKIEFAIDHWHTDKRPGSGKKKSKKRK